MAVEPRKGVMESLRAVPLQTTQTERSNFQDSQVEKGENKRGYQQTQTLIKRLHGAPAAVRNTMQNTEFWPPPIRLDLACNPEQNASNSSQIAL